MYQDTYDNVIGFVHVRDLLGPGAASLSVPVGRISRTVKFLPISKTVLSALSEMRRERAHLAIVVDDYGGTAGIVTLEDLVEELIGDIRDEYDAEHSEATTLHGGEVEVDGLLNLDEFTEQTGIELPEGPYETAAGYVLAALGDLPSVGDSVAGGRPHDHRDRTRRPAHRQAPRRARPTPAPARRAGQSGRSPAGQVRLDAKTAEEGG